MGVSVVASTQPQYNGQFILAKLDCDAEPMVASQFGLRAIPTVYLFQNGQPVDGFQGPQPEEAIRALLDKVLPREEELKAQEAMALMQEGSFSQQQANLAVLLRELPSVFQQRQGFVVFTFLHQRHGFLRF